MPFMPPKLVVDEDTHGCTQERWTGWKKRWDAFAVMRKLTDEDAEYQLACLTCCLSEEVLQVVDSLPYEKEADKKDVNKVLKLLREHLVGGINEIFESFKFFSRQQQEQESLTAYISAVRSLAASCNFGTLKDRLIRDRVVCGIRDRALQRTLLQDSELTLKRCEEKCRASESAGAQSRSIAQSQDYTPLNWVGHKERSSMTAEARAFPTSRACRYCGGQHDKGRCPAFGKKCNNCGRANHFTTVCQQRRPRREEGAVRHVDYGEELQHLEQCEEEWLLALENGSSSSAEAVIRSREQLEYSTKIFAELELQGQTTRFQVDTGATCNVLPNAKVPTGAEVRATDKVLRLYDSSRLKPVGVYNTVVRNPRTNRHYEAEFVVVASQTAIPLLGARSSQAMGLISVQPESIQKIDVGRSMQATADPPAGKGRRPDARIPHTKEEFLAVYADLFDGGLGRLPGKVHLEVEQNVAPVKLPLRKVPLALREDLQQELLRLQQLGVIAREDGPTDWVSSLVVARKASGKLRVCVDPKPLNKALKRCHYPLPVLEDFLHKLPNAKVFSICDISSGFWHVVLDEESSRLTTFATPQGRFRWKRLPFGIAPAPEIFQARLDAAIAGLEGVSTIVDDMVIWGAGETIEQAEEHHDRNLAALMQRCRERNIKLNPDKFQFRVPEVAYVGHRLSGNGLASDPAKVAAIRRMPTPTDKPALQRLLGMTNYLAKFLPGLSDMCQPLRQLLQDKVEWQWGTEHSDAVERIKEAVCQAPVLRFFNPDDPVTVQCDASSTGLGAALLQKEQPVAYASRTLSTTEQGYSQIERELLAVVFALTKFDHYVYGRPIDVHSDHQPLQTIAVKPLFTAPKRLQRMLLRLQRYDMAITYKPGKQMHLADTLSRATVQVDGQQLMEDVAFAQSEFERSLEDVSAVEDVTLSQPQLIRLREATARDEVLTELSDVIRRGWPERKEQVQPAVRPYYHVREELTTDDGVIFRGQRCVVPTSLRSEVLRKIHMAHMGTESSLRRARECVFWPGMAAQVKDYIDKCDTCQSYGRRQQRETFVQAQLPSRPWSLLGADLFHFCGQDYLLTVDYYSNYWEIDRLGDTLSSTVVKKMKQQFARHGIPDRLRSDNGPQFASSAFKKFAQEWQFQHVTSSPRYPQSNGKVENAVKTAKNIMLRAREAGTDPWLAVLAFRNTPTQGLETSPAQRLMGRRTQTTLPTHTSLLRPFGGGTTMEQFREAKLKQSDRYDKRAKDLPRLQAGTTVRVQPLRYGMPWRKALVVEELPDRSYRVETTDGSELRRNRRHLRQTKESFELEVPYEMAEVGRNQAAAAPPPEPEIEPVGSNVVRTRSGREIHRPRRFDDYKLN